MTGYSLTSHGYSSGHGGVRGDDLVRRSPLFEGRFGRLFRDLPPGRWDPAALMKLGERMSADPERDPKNSALPAAADEAGGPLQDDEENAGIPAGYTYFGQFIDHDLTFDPTPLHGVQNDPDALVDFRTPRFDLDSLYGRGPADEPYLYAPPTSTVASETFRLGVALTKGPAAGPGSPIVESTRVDLPRYLGPGIDAAVSSQIRAIIADKRNDENVIVAQLHSSLMQLHNKLAQTYPTEDFAAIQRRTRWHYQWLVINDFLPRICGTTVVDDILPKRLQFAAAVDKKPKLHFYRWREAPYMPLEFSVAAYRFGHSMVRPIYRLNTVHHGGANPLHASPSEQARGLAGRFFVFAGVADRGLNGFGKFPEQWAIDWSLFFDGVVDGQVQSDRTRTQPSYKIDPSLVNPLAFLPEFSVVSPAGRQLTIKALQAKAIDPVSNPANLAQRNLLRGLMMEIPSGQDVAEAMGIVPLTDDELRVGKAVVGDFDAADRAVDIDPSFAGSVPLWYYVLAEAAHQWRANVAADARPDPAAVPVTLGPVGGRIVAETIIGLMAADGSSFLGQKPNWLPLVKDGSLLNTVGALLRWVG